jgi:hypothetical protein
VSVGNPYEGIAICVIPATRRYDVYVSANSLRDSFVVVPVDLAGWTIIGLEVSYGEVESDNSADFVLQVRDTGYNVVSSYNYTHTGGVRNLAFGGLTIVVSEGQTINLDLQGGGTAPSASSEGYTITLTLENI